MSMHSYSNGSSLSVKKDNWEQIVKFLSKIPGLQECATSSSCGIDALVRCENGAAVAFLSMLYSKLTNRQVQKVLPTRDDMDIPPYAKSTDSAALREASSKSSLHDIREMQNQMQQVHESHQDRLDNDRDNSGYNNTSISQKNKVHRGKPHTVGEAPRVVENVQVKKVQVRSLNESNLVHLRQMRSGINATNSKEESNYDSVVDKVHNDASVFEMSETLPSFRSILNEIVQTSLPKRLLAEWNTPQNPKNGFQCFMESVCENGNVSEEESCLLLDTLDNDSAALALSALASPSDFCWVRLQPLFKF